jgi:small-conductance mechanosensitive channel
MLGIPLQTSTGGGTTIAIAVFVGQAVAFVIACWIAKRSYDGYRDARRSPLLWLALGIALLAAVPTVVRFLLPTLLGASSLTTTVLATASEIVGLTAILYTVYGRP